jgi:hypothetical protein
MGCGGSKEVDEKEIRKIKSEFPKVKIAKFDDFFEKASGLLENAEKLREGIEDGRDDGKELTDCYKLKNYEYTDVVKVLFWSLSANAKGNIKGTKCGVSEEAPFVHLDYFDGLLIETREVCDSFELFLKAVTGGPQAIVGIVESLTDMVGQSGDLTKNASDEFKAAGFNPIQSAKAVATLAKNVAKLGKEVPKCQRLPGLINEAVKDFKALVPKFKDIYKTADETGAKAFKEGNMKPKDIFKAYHPGDKKTEAELAAEQAAEDEKKGKKKGGKKDKKKDDKKKDEKKDEKKEEKK